MIDEVTKVAAPIVIEIGKALLIVLIQELMKRGMTSDQLDALYLNTKVEFMASNPDNIPEVK